jgi:hypothetical protein
MNKCRLEAFSDGIFAVAITLLVLDVNTGSLFRNCAGANFPTLYRFPFSTGKRRGGLLSWTTGAAFDLRLMSALQRRPRTTSDMKRSPRGQSRCGLRPARLPPRFNTASRRSDNQDKTYTDPQPTIPMSTSTPGLNIRSARGSDLNRRRQIQISHDAILRAHGRGRSRA